MVRVVVWLAEEVGFPGAAHAGLVLRAGDDSGGGLGRAAGRQHPDLLGCVAVIHHQQGPLLADVGTDLQAELATGRSGGFADLGQLTQFGHRVTG